jgi:hypothetical protein
VIAGAARDRDHRPGERGLDSRLRADRHPVMIA